MRVLGLLLLLSCATAPAPKPAELDPSNPDAPEAPLPAASTALDVSPLDAGVEAPPMEDHSHHHHHGGSR